VSRPLRALLGAAALLATTAAPAAADVTIRGVDTSRLPLVRVTATVGGVEAGHEPAFTVAENGVPVGRLTIGSPSSSLAIAIAIDTSQSMRGRPLADALGAAQAFLGRLRPADRIAVVGFGHRAEVVQSLTASPDALRAALASMAVDSVQGTALDDGIVTAARELAAAPTTSRRVLVVLTDGKDTSSAASAADARAALTRAQVAVYPIALHSSDYAPGPLRALASASGGTFRDARSAGLTDVYASIADELARTYVLDYSSGASERVVVTVTADGLTARTAYVGGAAAFRQASTGLVPASVTRSPWSGAALAGTVFVLVTAGALLVFRPRPTQPVRRRLAAYAEFSQRRVEETSQSERVPLRVRVARMTERTFGELRVWTRMAELIERADLALRTAELFYMMLGGALLLGVPAGLAGAPAPVGLVCLLVGFALPALVVRRKARKRSNAFDNQLPDTLTAMAASLKAGHSFNQAMETIIREGAMPTSKEFERVSNETRLGRPSDEAMEGMAQRIGSLDFEFVVMSVNIQRQVGGSLAELLDQIADTVRSRQQFRRKVKALTAMGRASAYTLVGMPFLMAGLLTLINPSYLLPLVNTNAGHIMVVTGLISVSFGGLILKKIVSFRI
jgi:tight adherence protein B